jgi:hypothetical protein
VTADRGRRHATFTRPVVLTCPVIPRCSRSSREPRRTTAEAVPRGGLRRWSGRASFETPCCARLLRMTSVLCVLNGSKQINPTKTGANAMTVFKVGKASIARIEETYQARPTAPPTSFRNSTDAYPRRSTPNGSPPATFDAATGFIKLSVHSWLVQDGGKQKILIDGCCGNNKAQAGCGRSGTCSIRPTSSASPPPARGRTTSTTSCARTSITTTSAGTRSLRDGTLGADLSECPLRHLQARLRLLSCKLDADRDKTEPVGVRHLPRMRAAGRRSRARRSRHRAAPPRRISSGYLPAPGHSAGHVVFDLESGGASGRSSSATSSTICCRSITRTGTSPRTPTPNRRA